ncbi:copia-like retrotransposon [Tanacetum coccineum]
MDMPEKFHQWRTSFQMPLAISQETKMWSSDSKSSSHNGQRTESKSIPRLSRLVLVGIRLQYTLSRSNAEAEYRDFANAVAAASWLRNLLRELHSPLHSTIVVYRDNVIYTVVTGCLKLLLDMDTGASSMMNFRMMNQECVKLDKFDGCTYTRWAEKMKFLLIVLKIYYVLDPELPPIPANPVPEPGKPMDEKKVSELEKQRMIRKEDKTLCCGHIKNSLSDTLYDLYTSVTDPREL